MNAIFYHVEKLLGSRSNRYPADRFTLPMTKLQRVTKQDEIDVPTNLLIAYAAYASLTENRHAPLPLTRGEFRFPNDVISNESAFFISQVNVYSFLCIVCDITWAIYRRYVT